MIIGFVIDDTLDKPDGVQAAIISLGNELTRRGHQVHYITAHTERTDIANIHSVGRFLSLRFNGNSVRTPLPASKKAIRTVLNEVTFDVLHIQMPFSPLLAGRLIRMAPPETRIFGTFHILPYDTVARLGTKILGYMSRKSAKKFTQFFAVSEPARVFLENCYGVSGSVLPNPVNVQFFTGFRRSKSDKKRMVFVGRFDERKGVRQLVQAYAALPGELRLSTELTMCGRGPLLEEVKHFAASHGLDASFPGFVSDEQKAQYLADADVAVFPSTGGESFGIVLAEAMAAGAGVTLGGNNPGYRSVLQLWPETLFDPDNLQAFTEKLRSALTADAYHAIGLAQHKAVHAYDTREVVDTLLAAYSA